MAWAEFRSVSVGRDGCEVTVSATVENTGETYPVQEVVQVYCSRPDSGKTGPAWFLDTFQKTQVLAPGEQQTLHLRFPVTELAIFREKASAYVLEGYYDIRVGSSSRATCLAGSIRLTRSAVVQAVTPCAFPDAELPARKEPVRLYTYPGEAEELETARRRAIRLSDRNLPRRSRKKGRPFTGCRGDNERHTLDEVKSGACSAFTFVAGMDDTSLRKLVCDFGFCPSDVPGALGASAELPRYGLQPMTIASGVCGLALKKDLEQDDGTIRQKTEDIIGPYEIHDFFLYHFMKYGASPEKILFLAKRAFGKEYPEEKLKTFLKTFIRRFFSQQFKRSCSTDGPKVGTISLSPRGDWRMPSDASPQAWSF